MNQPRSQNPYHQQWTPKRDYHSQHKQHKFIPMTSTDYYMPYKAVHGEYTRDSIHAHTHTHTYNVHAQKHKVAECGTQRTVTHFGFAFAKPGQQRRLAHKGL